LGRPQTVATIRRRTLCVGARLERKAVAAPACAPAEPATSITLSIDGGHIRAARQYQGRTFEVLLAQVSQHPAQATKSWPAKTEEDRMAGKRLAEKGCNRARVCHLIELSRCTGLASDID
ncbi:MAG TPA: hypothetical protein VHZ99_01745, partial [Steroidobacteraceae bacterium]|nr:hypothetical protein [Steroidobacteraceae bacterium]